MFGNDFVDMYKKRSKKKNFCNFSKSRNKNKIKKFSRTGNENFCSRRFLQKGIYKILLMKLREINPHFLDVNRFVATGAKFCTSGGLECAQFSFKNC